MFPQRNLVHVVTLHNSNTPKFLVYDEKICVRWLHWSILPDCLFKDYLHYKAITSENMPSEVQVKNFLYFWFCIFSYPMIYQMRDVMISIS